MPQVVRHPQFPYQQLPLIPLPTTEDIRGSSAWADKLKGWQSEVNAIWARTLWEITDWFGGGSGGLCGLSSQRVLWADPGGCATNNSSGAYWDSTVNAMAIGAASVEDPADHMIVNVSSLNGRGGMRVRNDNDGVNAQGAYSIYNPDSYVGLEKCGNGYAGTGARQSAAGLVFNTGTGGLNLVSYGQVGVGGANAGPIRFYTNGDQSTNLQMQITTVGDLRFFEGRNIEVGTTVGSKIGTSTSQKLAFHNSTPIIQEVVTGSAAGNAALIDLLTKLDNKGLIDNQTTT